MTTGELQIQLQTALGHLQSGRLEAATAAYADLVQSFPNLPEAWNNLAVALRLSSRGRAAVEAATRATQLAPQIAATHDNLGAALLIAGRPWDAIAPLLRATAHSQQRVGSSPAAH